MKCLERLICIYCGLIYFFGDLFRAGVVICALPRTSVEYDSITLNIHDDVESQQTGALQILDRVRRSDTSDKKCGVTGDTRADSWPLKNDKNFNLALVWVGKNSVTQLLLTTLEINFLFKIKLPSKLYRSTDGGFTFQLIQNEIQNGDIRKDFGILKSTLNPDKVILISYSYTRFIFTQPSKLYISTNGGIKWKIVNLSFKIREKEPILLHPTKEKWLLALEEGNRYGAWLSTDFGTTWKKLKDYVSTVKWGALEDGKEENTIFLTVRPPSSIASLPLLRQMRQTDSTLWRSRDLGKNFKELFTHVYNLGMQGKFLFVSVDYKKEAGKRIIHVSKDGGDSFRPVHVDAISTDKFYSVLDLSEGMIFLHVDSAGDTGHGTLYTSGADGVMYTKSLERHFYTNEGVTDFYKVESMRGTYITHQLNTTDNSITSVITFNRGASWEFLHLTETQCKGAVLKPNGKCSLHFHYLYSKTKGIDVEGPLSHPTALGLIMLHGMHGDGLTSKADVYLSRDGGYLWNKVLNGSHHYAIGDHGNLIVALKKPLSSNETSNTLTYSFDQGRCWNTLKFNNEPLVIRGLVTEPNAKKRAFSLWGYKTNQVPKEWRVITVDFGKLFKRPCNQNDYDYWTPHSDNRKDGCLLGIKESYPRTKDKVFCYKGENYDAKPDIKVQHCKCTLDDLECEYGYDKDKTGQCNRNSKPLEICRNGEEVQLNEYTGYRRVPGDNCQGGVSKRITKVIKFVDEGKKCKGQEIAENSYGQISDPKLTKKKGVNKALIFVGVVPVVLVAIGIAVYLIKKYLDIRSNKPTFRYSQLVQNEDDELIQEVDGYDPRPKSLRPYKDNSDEESDTQMIDI